MRVWTAVRKIWSAVLYAEGVAQVLGFSIRLALRNTILTAMLITVPGILDCRRCACSLGSTGNLPACTAGPQYMSVISIIGRNAGRRILRAVVPAQLCRIAAAERGLTTLSDNAVCARSIPDCQSTHGSGMAGVSGYIPPSMRAEAANIAS